MRTIITIFLLSFLTATAPAQKKASFIRVFDESGKTIQRGFLQKTTDSSLVMTVHKKTVEIPVTQISILKLRRSFGHTVLVTSLIAAGSLAILGAATADPDAWIFGYTVAEGIASGLISGVLIGGAAGSIIAGTRNRPVIKLDRKIENWPVARDALRIYLIVE
ncbi:MAG TPA: hypothetical protein VFX58_14325 [Chitinophagaceae bacterium]|nr:hypothetical protein [Chitinophagaceae bacterium]